MPWCEDDAFIGVVPPPMPGDEPSKRAPAEQTGSAQPPLPDTGARRYLHALRPARAHPEFSEGSLYKEVRRGEGAVTVSLSCLLARFYVDIVLAVQ